MYMYIYIYVLLLCLRICKMEKSLPHSIEKQTGCFLKQLKRSVSLSNDKNDSLKTGTSSELIEIAGNSLNESQLMMAVTENQNIYRERTKFNEHMIDSQILAGSVTSTQTEIFQSPTNSPVHSTGVGYRQHSTHATPSKNSLSIAENTLRTTLNTDNLNFLLKPIGILQMADTTNNEVLNIASVADLLHPQYAIITGGRSADGCPLIIFPDNNNFCSIEEADYQKLVSYLASVTSLQEADLGFNLIVDRRKDRWSSVRTVLQRISEYFPGIIHVVYVIRPSGLFQKALSEVSNKFSRDEYRFRLVVCSTVSDLHDYIHISQLTPDMGGYLIYSHHEWIQQRIVSF
ncbi:guanine nucleotide exchange factor DBS-like [Drosophila ficusphila]|uniref:guanine nucleotide exchange factor DBS-like n=1 Tax=Drosophila ficusphila TaxID=30025 RepID=UPI001C8A01B4|nr:guanine nucleotide exchange factor DBS-like [Drosophila ficusphila]